MQLHLNNGSFLQEFFVLKRDTCRLQEFNPLFFSDSARFEPERLYFIMSSEEEDDYMNESLKSDREENLEESVTQHVLSPKGERLRTHVSPMNDINIMPHRPVNNFEKEENKQEKALRKRRVKKGKRTKTTKIGKKKKARRGKTFFKEKKKNNREAPSLHEWKAWDQRRPNYYTPKDIIEKASIKGLCSFRRNACSACNRGIVKHEHLVDPISTKSQIRAFGSPQKVGVLTKTTTPRGQYRYQQKIETIYDTIYKHSYDNRTPIKELLEEHPKPAQL
jgi:hypothetical protein